MGLPPEEGMMLGGAVSFRPGTPAAPPSHEEVNPSFMKGGLEEHHRVPHK
jgi:hypothetical protein